MSLRSFQKELLFVILFSLCYFKYYECVKPVASKPPVSSVANLPPGFKNLNDYNIVTWNCQSKATKWKYFAQMLLTNKLDVLAVQEVGAINDKTVPGTITGPNFSHNIPTVLMGIDVDATSCFPDIIAQYEWTFTINDVGNTALVSWIKNNNLKIVGNQSFKFYVYVYDCKTNKNGPKTTTLMIIMRENPSRLFVIPSETSYDASDAANEEVRHDIFINRPSIGVELGGNLIFNVHPRPHQHGKKTSSNEAHKLVESIHNYIKTDDLFARYRPTWIMIGDFNKEPPELSPQIAQLVPRVRIVNTNEITHPGINGQADRELDYGVAGGDQLTIDRLQAHLYSLDINNPRGDSDHFPVMFSQNLPFTDTSSKRKPAGDLPRPSKKPKNG